MNARRGVLSRYEKRHGDRSLRQANLTLDNAHPILDKIDYVLAGHYGSTDEELDFIIDYDIKYRMWRKAGHGE